ncbi:MAG: hypothetical protein IT428_24870 [Planctomycetaceae bacterium]|nr:hypothetical protein [Planctomycetaceae bacterium]
MNDFAAMTVFLFLAWTGLGWFVATSSPSFGAFVVNRDSDRERVSVSVPLVICVLIMISGTIWFLGDIAR